MATAPKRGLSVRAKILLTVIASVLALSVVIYVISTEVILKSYLALEQEAVRQDLRRATDAIDSYVGQQTAKIRDWAQWDDANAFALDRNEVFASEIAIPIAALNLDINAMIVSDTAGYPFHVVAVDLVTGEEVATTTIGGFFAAHKELLIHTDLESSREGFYLLPEGILIFTTRPTINTDGSGPSNGALTFARFLEEEKVQELADTVHLSFALFRFADTNLPDDVAAAKQVLTSDAEDYIVPSSPELVRGYTLLKDYAGNPALILRLEAPRPIYAQGNLTFYLFMGIGGLALLVFGSIMLLLLERLVIARFVRLTRDVEEINEEKDISIGVKESGNDDIGALSGKINQMLTWVSRAREAEAASKAEVTRLKDKAEEMVVQRTKELADEKARLLASINSLALGFVIASKDGTIVLKNPVLGPILGLSTEATSIQDIAKAITEFDLIAFVKDSLERTVAREEKAVSYGKKFLRFYTAPIFTEGTSTVGGIIGSVLLIEDITEAKVLERSREEFFSIASHELRTPLTAIRGNAGMLLSAYKDKLPDGEMKEMLTDIDASSARLIEIVNDFLEVSRLEQGKIKIKKETFDVQEVIQTVVREMHELVTHKGLSLVCVPSEVPPVSGDKGRVEQVLTNLIGNAVKFTEQGSITIETAVEGAFLRVRVTDTGVGISEQNQTRLFRKFQQAGEDMLARDVSQSTGLGLYISRLITTAMGGEIVLETSELGKGSTFSFTLPLA